jgi:hypothetical protein
VLDAPFHAEGNIATAGGCLASQYLATWVITRTLGEDASRDVIDYVAPVGENQETVERALRAVHTGEVALRPRHRPGHRTGDRPAQRPCPPLDLGSASPSHPHTTAPL